MAASQCNWFEVVDYTLAGCNYGEEEEAVVIKQLDDYYSSILTSDTLTCEQRRLMQQSHDAFVCDREDRLPLAQVQAAALNGEIITDSESDDSEQYIDLR